MDGDAVDREDKGKRNGFKFVPFNGDEMLENSPRDAQGGDIQGAWPGGSGGVLGGGIVGVCTDLASINPGCGTRTECQVRKRTILWWKTRRRLAGSTACS